MRHTANGLVTMLAIGNYGRAGNMFFQVAGVIGIARRNGLSPVFPLLRNKEHLERFSSTEDIDVYNHFVNPLPSIPDGISFTERPVGWGYEDVRLPPGNWNVSGHFQSFRYFEHCADEVKWYFRMKDEEPSDYCAIHYRAGDYQIGQQSYHPRMPVEYYRRAVKHFPDNQKFMMFSDDRDEASRICEAIGIEYVLSPGADYIADFRLMKGCKDFIIANSSFSAMAAWLGDYPEKRVVSPSGYNWFGDIAGITGADIMDRDWIQIRFDKSEAA